MKNIIFILAICFAVLIGCSKDQNTDNTSNTDKIIISQLYGSYCCDSYGYRRCVIVNPLPVGSLCYCLYQGYGSVCM